MIFSSFKFNFSNFQPFGELVCKINLGLCICNGNPMGFSIFNNFEKYQ